MLGVLELDHPAGVDVDQVVVVAVLGRLVAGAAAAEIAPLQDALLLQQPHRAVDRGDRDARVQRAGAAIQFLDVGMVGGLGQHPRDDPALAGHLEASFDAQALDAASIAFHRPSSGSAAATRVARCRLGRVQSRRRPRLRRAVGRAGRAGEAGRRYGSAATCRPRGLVPRPIFLASDERCLA